MKSYVVVTVEGGSVQSCDVFPGDEPGVEEPLVIDWGVLDSTDLVDVHRTLDEYEEAARELPVFWMVRSNILIEVRHQRGLLPDPNEQSRQFVEVMERLRAANPFPTQEDGEEVITNADDD